MEGSTRPIADECLSLEVTTACNSRCRHCFVRNAYSKITHLPLHLVKTIINEGHENAYRHLHFTGGEPFLWDPLFPAIDYAFEIGYDSLLINTNGTLLSEMMCKKLSTYPGLKISVSVEGPEALHDRIRGKGAWLNTLKGLERAFTADIDILVFTTVTQRLLSELPRFAEDLYQCFPEMKYLVLIQLIRPDTETFLLEEELLEPTDFRKLVQTVSLLNLYGLKVCIKNQPLAGIVAKAIHMPWIPITMPLYRDRSLMITANGEIRMVHSDGTVLGRYSPGMLSKTHQSDRYQQTIRPDQSICPDCGHSEICAQNGMDRPAPAHFDLHVDSPYCQRVLDQLIPYSNKMVQNR